MQEPKKELVVCYSIIAKPAATPRDIVSTDGPATRLARVIDKGYNVEGILWRTRAQFGRRE